MFWSIVTLKNVFQQWRCNIGKSVTNSPENFSDFPMKQLFCIFLNTRLCTYFDLALTSFFFPFLDFLLSFQFIRSVFQFKFSLVSHFFLSVVKLKSLFFSQSKILIVQWTIHRRRFSIRSHVGLTLGSQMKSLTAIDERCDLFDH